jgi:predicted nuclease with RNAse H fold
MGASPIVGIDLTAGGRPTATAALSADLTTCDLALLATDEDLLEFVRQHNARFVAIDAPLGLPGGQCCLELSCACAPTAAGSGRACERALSKLGIGCYYTTKRSIIKSLVYRGMRLQNALREMACTVLEVYPYATKVRLFGRRLPGKATPEGMGFIAQAISRLIRCDPGPLDHDRADAVLCAYTGWLYTHKRTEALGDESEGCIHIPSAA